MRRFIAGAVCPRCGLQDKLFVDSEADVRECVSCGFREARPVETPGEVPTRVTRAVSRRADAPAESVRIVGPGGDAEDAD